MVVQNLQATVRSSVPEFKPGACSTRNLKNRFCLSGGKLFTSL